MGCERWQEALSALADGEDPGVEPRLLDAHLAGCAACRSFQTMVDVNLGPTRLGEAPAMPDLSRRVVKLNAIADRALRWGAVRGLLAISAVQIIVLSAPALVLGDEGGSSAHTARHLGAFAVAYAVGLLVVAVRPARARTMLPVAVVLGAALVVSGVIDSLDATTGPLGEVAHLPELLSVVLVWLLARPAPAPSSSARVSPPLRAVDTDPAEQRRDELG